MTNKLFQTPVYQTPLKIKLKFDAITEPKKFWQDKRVLDIGCNAGLLYPLLKEAGIKEYIGIDSSEEYIAIAKETFPKLDFRLMDFWDWSEKVDIAISLSTFHILKDEDFEKVLYKYSELCKVLIVECPVVGESPLYHARPEKDIMGTAIKFFDTVSCYGISPSPHDPQSIRKVFKCVKKSR